MSIWVIQRIEALSVCDRRDLAYGYKSLFVDQFSNENNLATALQEGGITGVSQYNMIRTMIITMAIPTYMKTQTTLLEYPLITQQPATKFQEWPH